MRLPIIYQAIMGFFASLFLICVPYPIGISLRLLGYREGDGIRTDSLQFCSLGNFVCLSHLIAAGWVVALAALLDIWLKQFTWGWLPLEIIVRIWLIILLLTLAVLAFQVDRYVLFLLMSWGMISILAIAVLELASRQPLSIALVAILCVIPVSFDWGLPVLVSTALGMLYAGAATWSRLNNLWCIPKKFGNEIYHHNFERRDRSIYRPGRTFVAEYPCLIRKYLFFGYGNIEVRSAGGMQKDVISGVIFAEHFARRLVRDHLIHGNTRHVEMESLLEEEAESESGANSATFTPHLESSN